MNRLTCVVALAAVLGAPRALETSYASAPDQDLQAPTYRGRVDLVTVNVSVENGLSVVTKLTAPDFQVLDDGVPQEVATVTYGTLPIDVTVALDVSASVKGAPLARLRHGVAQLASGLATGDRLRLVAFNHEIRQVLDFDSDPKTVEIALASLSAGGGTSIFDALSVAMLAPADPNRRQFVTLFTDGSDGLSVTEPRMLLEAARRAQASVTAVMPRGVAAAGGLVGPRGGLLAPGAVKPDSGRRPEALLHQQVALVGDIATLTGGRILVDPGPPQDLGSSFRRALDDFRSSYVLYFTPRDVEHAGFHTLQVTVRGHAGYSVRARTGYFRNQ
jgi:VWFA-related protein